eukprot:GHRR01032239.1.p1 GENE.GHRR01032239.1~~GHRR01032239.1.p1  ORF type:complete len:172 (+),score=58.81 GHRR01032239.1:404-919(+)
MAELAGNNSDRRQIEFEALKLAAEAQMRRCAPPLDSRAAKRLRLDSSDEATHEAKRYSYAAYGVVIKGCTCFVATSDFRRERSSTKEVIELLQQVIPGGPKAEPRQQQLQQLSSCNHSCPSTCSCQHVVYQLPGSAAVLETPSQSGVIALLASVGPKLPGKQQPAVLQARS